MPTIFLAEVVNRSSRQACFPLLLVGTKHNDCLGLIRHFGDCKEHHNFFLSSFMATSPLSWQGNYLHCQGIYICMHVCITSIMG